MLRDGGEASRLSLVTVLNGASTWKRGRPVCVLPDCSTCCHPTILLFPARPVREQCCSLAQWFGQIVDEGARRFALYFCRYPRCLFLLVFCPPRLADTVRATPMTTWRVCLSREDRRKHQEKPEDISKPSCHRVASGIRRLNTSSVSQDTRNPTGGGYGKVDASVLYDKCQPMWGGNCIPQVVGAGHQAAPVVCLTEYPRYILRILRSMLFVMKEAVGNVLPKCVPTECLDLIRVAMGWIDEC